MMGFCRHISLYHCSCSAQQIWPGCCTGRTASIDSAVRWHDIALSTCCRRQAPHRRCVPHKWASMMQGTLQRVGLVTSGTEAAVKSQGSGDK